VAVCRAGEDRAFGASTGSLTARSRPAGRVRGRGQACKESCLERDAVNMSERVWVGSWWRPGRDEEVGGKLTLDDRGCSLQLFGSFASWNGDELTRGGSLPLTQSLKEPLIHGIASWHCWRGGAKRYRR